MLTEKGWTGEEENERRSEFEKIPSLESLPRDSGGSGVGNFVKFNTLSVK